MIIDHLKLSAANVSQLHIEQVSINTRPNNFADKVFVSFILVFHHSPCVDITHLALTEEGDLSMSNTLLLTPAEKRRERASHNKDWFMKTNTSTDDANVLMCLAILSYRRSTADSTAAPAYDHNIMIETLASWQFCTENSHQPNETARLFHHDIHHDIMTFIMTSWHSHDIMTFIMTPRDTCCTELQFYYRAFFKWENCLSVLTPYVHPGQKNYQKAENYSHTLCIKRALHQNWHGIGAKCLPSTQENRVDRQATH